MAKDKEMIEAIDQGIQKWKDIRDSKLILWRGVVQCSLCTRYRRKVSSVLDACRHCPLHISGKPCFNTDESDNIIYDTNWGTYNNNLTSSYNLRIEDLEWSKEKHTIYKCILTMINDLVRAKLIVPDDDN